jgi:hypothetical protein
MRIPSPVLAIAVAASSLASACVSDETADELAGEDGDGEAGKEDGTGAYNYFQSAIEPRVDTELAGFIVSRSNRTTVSCAGLVDSSCFVRSFDWSRSGLTEDIARQLETELRGGADVLLRGDVVTETVPTRNRRLGVAGAASLRGEATTELAAVQPSLSIGADNGPDCLYANLDVSKIDVGSAIVTAAPSLRADDPVHFDILLDNVTVTARATYAVSCVNGSQPVTLRMMRVTLTADAVPGSSIVSVSTSAIAHVAVDGLASAPQAVQDMLALDTQTRAGQVIAANARALLMPIAAAETGPQLQLTATEAWLPGGGDATDASDDVFVHAKQSGTRIREARLNSTRTATIDLIDFEASGADGGEIEAARADLAGAGVILSGPRYTQAGKPGRRALRFWTRAAN